MNNGTLIGFLAMSASLITLSLLTSCTISFENISSNGTSRNLGDDQFTQDPTVSPTLTVPLK